MWVALESGSFDVSLAITWDLSRYHFQSLLQRCLGYHTSHALNMTSSAERSFNPRQHCGFNWNVASERSFEVSLDHWISLVQKVVVWAPLMSSMWTLLRREPSIGDSIAGSIEIDLLVLSGIISQQFWVQDGAPQSNLRYGFTTWGAILLCQYGAHARIKIFGFRKKTESSCHCMTYIER